MPHEHHEHEHPHESYGPGDPFYLIEQNDNPGTYLEEIDKASGGAVWTTVYDDAAWTYHQPRATTLITTHSLDANVKSFSGGSTHPVGQPPF